MSQSFRCHSQSATHVIRKVMMCSKQQLRAPDAAPYLAATWAASNQDQMSRIIDMESVGGVTLQRSAPGAAPYSAATCASSAGGSGSSGAATPPDGMLAMCSLIIDDARRPFAAKTSVTKVGNKGPLGKGVQIKSVCTGCAIQGE